MAEGGGEGGQRVLEETMEGRDVGKEGWKGGQGRLQRV